MNKEEYFTKLKDVGIDLANYPQIVVDKYVNQNVELGIYQSNGLWSIYTSDGEHTPSVKTVYHDENKAYQDFYDLTLKEIVKMIRYFYDMPDLSANIFGMTKDEFIKQAAKKWSYYMPTTKIMYPEHNLDQIWERLTKDICVLFEAKYLIATGNFPKKHPYHVHGYSAEDIYNIFKDQSIPFEKLDAFLALINLEYNPKRVDALNELKFEMCEKLLEHDEKDF